MCKLKLAIDNHNEFQKVELLKEIKNSISHEATMFSGYEQHVSECWYLKIFLTWCQN